jgi:hypothetical protein
MTPLGCVPGGVFAFRQELFRGFRGGPNRQPPKPHIVDIHGGHRERPDSTRSGHLCWQRVRPLIPLRDLAGGLRAYRVAGESGPCPIRALITRVRRDPCGNSGHFRCCRGHADPRSKENQRHVLISCCYRLAIVSTFGRERRFVSS